MSKNPNKLISEKSPYLLQHAYNPVNWFPWSEEAFEKARIEDKPIFLSIGYSTCHWCHVMEKESFEDDNVAKLMDEAFISIKVDREERPDIDGIYMSVCQMITGSGGWPLTVVMTPDKKPFFVGTYFPKHNRFNRIGMMELIPKLKEIWLNQKDEVLKSADEIASTLNSQNFIKDSVRIEESILDRTFEDLLNRFDNDYGGFGKAPKFPSPHNLLFLLNYWKNKNNSEALEIVEKTLTKMRLGGIYDHIGFGFARYSTDQYWLVPHFEKMLYDQAMLIMAYSELYSITKNELYKKTVEEIVEYILRDMTHPEGGFYSAEDADSEGEEGKFYLWTEEEIQNILDKSESEIAIKIFNISNEGNWVDESKGMKTGTNILHLNNPIDELSNNLNLNKDEFLIPFHAIREKLFNSREKRVHPYKDDKILTDWNSLMISALTKAFQAFDNEYFISAAVKACRFIEKNLTTEDGKLLHRYRDGESGLQAHLDDYSFLINACLDLYEATFEIEYLKRALQLNKILFNEFWDEQNGGFFFSSNLSEKLITRQKEVYDGAIPSGNSIALLNLIRLARITGKIEFENQSQKLIKYFSGYISHSPSAFSMFMYGLSVYFTPSVEVVIICKQIDKTVLKTLEIIKQSNKNIKTILIKTDNNTTELDLLIPFTSGMKMMNNNPTFYVCNNFVCNKPTNSLNELKELLGK